MKENGSSWVSEIDFVPYQYCQWKQMRILLNINNDELTKHFGRYKKRELAYLPSTFVLFISLIYKKNII